MNKPTIDTPEFQALLKDLFDATALPTYAAQIKAFKPAREAFITHIDAQLARQQEAWEWMKKERDHYAEELDKGRQHQGNGEPAGWREAMQEFCDRVERGEVRSKRTYEKFKALLTAPAQAQHAEEAPKGMRAAADFIDKRAEAVYQYRSNECESEWIGCGATTQDELKKRGSADLFEFRTLYTSPAAQHAESYDHYFAGHAPTPGYSSAQHAESGALDAPSHHQQRNRNERTL